jgi:hypothetical protein
MLAPSPSPQEWPSRGLMSLWIMLRRYAAEFVFLAQLITDLKGHFKTDPDATLAEILSAPNLDEKVRAYWPGLIKLTQTISLPSVLPQMERIDHVLSGKHSDKQLFALMTALYDRLEDDLNAQWFFHVRPERASFYNDPDLFGEQVALAYRGARDDIEAAGKCLVLEQGTATVFHLMGVMEIGLRSLGQALGIEYAPSWEAYIKQINANMAQEHKKKPADWKKSEAFYRDLLAEPNHSCKAKILAR